MRETREQEIAASEEVALTIASQQLQKLEQDIQDAAGEALDDLNAQLTARQGARTAAQQALDEVRRALDDDLQTLADDKRTARQDASVALWQGPQIYSRHCAGITSADLDTSAYAYEYLVSYFPATQNLDATDAGKHPLFNDDGQAVRDPMEYLKTLVERRARELAPSA